MQFKSKLHRDCAPIWPLSITSATTDNLVNTSVISDKFTLSKNNSLKNKYNFIIKTNTPIYNLLTTFVSFVEPLHFCACNKVLDTIINNLLKDLILLLEAFTNWH